MIIWIISVGIPLLLLVFWAWMFWEFANNRSTPRDQDIFWLLGFIFLSVLTAGYYYLTVYRKEHS